MLQWILTFIVGLSLSASPASAEEFVELQNALVDVAKTYASMDHIPYVWGGSSIGSEEVCQACRSCVQEKKVSLTRRLSRCTPCRKCGMDCSHFITRVFQDVGIDFRYASSSVLGRQDKPGLLHHYGLIDVGLDLSLAQPGDILVYPRHVVLLVQVNDATRGDIIHSTRFRQGDRMSLGGIRYDQNINLKNHRGKLRRILRHQRLFKNHLEFVKPSANRVPVG